MIYDIHSGVWGINKKKKKFVGVIILINSYHLK